MSDSTVIKELDNLKNEIEKSKEQSAVLQGRRQEILKQAKKLCNVKTMGALSEWVEKQRTHVIALNKKMDNSYKKLTEDFDW